VQRLLSSLSQHSTVGLGSFHTKHTFEKAHTSSLKGAVKLTALLHEPCAPHLASIHTGGKSAALSQPKESMWPVNQMVLPRKLPYSVTPSHKRTKHILSRFGNESPTNPVERDHFWMGPVEKDVLLVLYVISIAQVK